MGGDTVACPRCENVTTVPGSSSTERKGAGIDPGIAAAVRQSVGSRSASDDVVLHDTACLDCGYNLKGLPLDATCPECGMWVKRSVFTSTVPKHRKPKCSRTVYVLLGALLGQLGVHNFAAGFVGRGIVQLLMTVLSFGILAIPVWIWAVVEIATRTTDANGVEMS